MSQEQSLDFSKPIPYSLKMSLPELLNQFSPKAILYAADETVWIREQYKNQPWYDQTIERIGRPAQRLAYSIPGYGYKYALESWESGYDLRGNRLTYVQRWSHLASLVGLPGHRFIPKYFTEVAGNYVIDNVIDYRERGFEGIAFRLFQQTLTHLAKKAITLRR